MSDSDSDADAENRDSSENTCACCDVGIGQEAERTATGDRWLSGSDVLDATLPIDVQESLGRILGEESVETMGEWVGEIRRRTGGGSISVDDLCHSGDETEHWGEMDRETYHFLCFYDAVILSALAHGPVDIRTKSPGGTVIEVHAAGTSKLTVTPKEAVFSFGVDEAVEPPEDGVPSFSDVYTAVCPYVRAFPDRETCERWAESVPAATVAMPLASATEIAAALVE